MLSFGRNFILIKYLKSGIMKKKINYLKSRLLTDRVWCAVGLKYENIFVNEIIILNNIYCK